jgi:uncharacterized protein (TIGR02058 family)
MPKKRVILELGTGNDLHGSDYTKAALRAVQDALHHSSLSFIRSLIIDKTKLDVEVTIGVQRPEQVDLEKVKNSLPVGNVTVTAIKGGLDVADPENNDPAVIASAAIAVRIEVMPAPGGDTRERNRNIVHDMFNSKLYHIDIKLLFCLGRAAEDRPR